MSITSGNHELITDSLIHTCKTLVITSQDQKTPREFISFRNYHSHSYGHVLQIVFFAYPTSTQDAHTVARVIISIVNKHAYLPTTVFSDRGSALVCRMIEEVAEVLGIKLQQATTKHAQTIEVFERKCLSFKKELKAETCERRSMWHEYVSNAVLSYNTSYHAGTGCEPRGVFQGHLPYYVHDSKRGTRPQKTPTPNSQVSQHVLEQTKSFSRTLARMPCKIKSRINRTMTRKQTPQNGLNKTMCMFYSSTQIIKEVKLIWHISIGLVRTTLKRFCQTTITWYKKLEWTKPSTSSH